MAKPYTKIYTYKYCIKNAAVQLTINYRLVRATQLNSIFDINFVKQWTAVS